MIKCIIIKKTSGGEVRMSANSWQAPTNPTSEKRKAIFDKHGKIFDDDRVFDDNRVFDEGFRVSRRTHGKVNP